VKNLSRQELMQKLVQAKQEHAALGKKYQRNIEALQASTRLLKEKDEGMLSLQEFLEEVFYRAKLDGSLLELSPSIYKVSGYHPEELIGHNVLDYYADPEQRDDYIIALQSKGAVREFPIELIAKDGHLINFSMNSRIVFQNGQAAYIEGAMTDQTENFRLLNELKKARDEALGASKAKSDFLAIMSHELRTPIHGLMGMLGLLGEEKLNERQREYLSSAEYSVQVLRDQVNNILDLSKVEAGMMELQKQRFDMTLCVREVVSMLAFQASEKGLIFETIWENSPHFVMGDVVRLQQILLNLLGNAIKFTTSGFVRLRISQQASSFHVLHFSVEDSGVGLSESEQATVFEPFTQVDVSTTRHHAGTGLGTTIAQRLIHLMGGEIRVRSELGKGSQFHFFVTLDACEEGSVHGTWDAFQLKRKDIEPEQVASVNVLRGDKKRVLLADDDPIGLKIVSKALIRHGFEVMTAKNGLVALEMATHYAYDLILLDMQMPHLDGASVTEKIRHIERQEKSEPVPIIGLSAHALDAVRKRCEEVGMNAFLVKPIQMDDVLLVLEEEYSRT